MAMTGLERCLCTMAGGVPDRVPGYTSAVDSEVASRLLGREAHTGGMSLWHAEAKAWVAGPSAFAARLPCL